MLCVDIGLRVAQRLGIELMELAIAPLLRPLVPEHRSRGPHPLRALIGQVVLDRRTHDAGSRLGTQRQALAVVVEGVHLLFDDIGRVADAADEQRRRLDDRHAEIAVTVLRERLPRGLLDALPKRCLVGQDVVHAANGLDRRRVHALAASAVLDACREAAAGNARYSRGAGDGRALRTGHGVDARTHGSRSRATFCRV